MKLTLKDLKTGRTADIDSDASIGWWAWGNGSCDCNRALEFDGLDEALRAESQAAYPDAWASVVPNGGICYGPHRIVIIACDDPEADLAFLNDGYPDGSWI